MNVVFVFRTQEELHVREEDQQTITVEVELKRHDSEPTISVPQPANGARYDKHHTDSHLVQQNSNLSYRISIDMKYPWDTTCENSINKTIKM